MANLHHHSFCLDSYRKRNSKLKQTVHRITTTHDSNHSAKGEITYYNNIFPLHGSLAD